MARSGLLTPKSFERTEIAESFLGYSKISEAVIHHLTASTVKNQHNCQKSVHQFPRTLFVFEAF